MGMDLIGRAGEFSVHESGWEYLLELARENGWEPGGTIEMEYSGASFSQPYPDESQYVGNRLAGYYSNDGQLVTESDATVIAAALRRAIADPTRSLDAEHRRLIEGCATFCEKGGFRIL